MKRICQGAEVRITELRIRGRYVRCFQGGIKPSLFLIPFQKKKFEYIAFEKAPLHLFQRIIILFFALLPKSLKRRWYTNKSPFKIFIK